MNKQRNLTELVGRVVELKEDNKRYLVMPFELRGHDFKSIIGTIEGRVTYKDLMYEDTIALIPLDEVPKQRRKHGDLLLEGKNFTVRNAMPKERERIEILNQSMLLVLDNMKELYTNLTELKKLEQKQAKIQTEISKLKDTNSGPLDKWARPADNAYLLELYKNEINTIKAKERLKDPNRPLYHTSLVGKSNAGKAEVLELLKTTDKKLYHRYGLSYRGAKAKPITREQAIHMWLHGGPNHGFIDMDEEKDSVIIGEYSSNDMY